MQFETGTFFSTDSFNISPEKTDDATKAIEPVAQRMVRFFGDHPHQKFEVVIACSGTPADEDQYVMLCELRARSVANLLIDQIRSNGEFIPKPDWIHYDVKWVGKGEALPYSDNKKQHKPEDKRHGTVSLTWNVLPASLYCSNFP